MKKRLCTAFALLSFSAQAATITVDTNDDIVNVSDGKTSLREAIDQANSTTGVADTIEFNLTGTTPADRTITLTNGEMEISDTLTINGGVDGVTIDANNKSRIFNASQPLVIDRLTLTQGGGVAVTDGGAIYTTADVTVSNSTLTRNKAAGGGRFSPTPPSMTTPAPPSPPT